MSKNSDKNNNLNFKVFKTRIYPTKEQIPYFEQAFGVRRWCYNWGIERFIESWKNNENSDKKVYLTNYDLAKMLNAIKDQNYPWLNKVNGMVRKEAFRDLKESVDRYFKALKDAKSKGDKVNPQKYRPKFKSKKNSNDSFRYHMSDREHPPIRFISKHYFRMATSQEFSGAKSSRYAHTLVKSRENLLFLNSPNYRVCEYNFTRSCGKYYLSISYERTNQRKLSKPDENTCIGIDMGLKHALTCYDGNESWYFDIPELLKFKYEKRSERKRRQLDKKRENIKQYNKILSSYNKINYNHSKHYQKLHLQLSKCYNKENNVKKDFRENYTAWLVQNYHTIKIEEYNFNLESMSDMHMARNVARVGGYTFVERLKQKSKEYGTNLIFIPKFTPTTQTCSCCGHRYTGNDKLTLHDRIYHCPKCNTSIDRDINASINIFNFKPLEQDLVTTLKQ